MLAIGVLKACASSLLLLLLHNYVECEQDRRDADRQCDDDSDTGTRVQAVPAARGGSGVGGRAMSVSTSDCRRGRGSRRRGGTPRRNWPYVDSCRGRRWAGICPVAAQHYSGHGSFVGSVAMPVATATVVAVLVACPQAVSLKT
jgi:hypothetical protein